MLSYKISSVKRWCLFLGFESCVHKRQLTVHARGRRDSHCQNELILALGSSVLQMNPVPPAAGNAGRWHALAKSYCFEHKNWDL